MASAFLIPQALIPDVFARLAAHPDVVAASAALQAFDGPIDSNLIDALVRAIGQSGSVFLPKTPGYKGYTWAQDGDLLTITYESPSEITVYDITIAGQEIDSPFISGKFFGLVLDHDIAVRGRRARVQLRTENAVWPILIAGGSIDATSIFLLANAAVELGDARAAEQLLTYGAVRGQADCIARLAEQAQEGSPRDFFYWNFRLAQTGDAVGAIQVAIYLLKFDSTAEFALVNENLLIALAQRGIGVAFHHLALLHMSGIRGFNADRALAVRYLTVAAADHGIREAAELLEKVGRQGALVPRDAAAGEAGRAAAESGPVWPIVLAGAALLLAGLIVARRLFKSK
jgi:hypothetical protein